MEITEIKQQLSLANVLNYYHLKPDKNLRLHCPFHDDKTPSLQVYYKTHTAYCFSSNCKTHGKSLDVIDFILYKENCTKHEAILKAVEIINYLEGKVSHQHKAVNNETVNLAVSQTQFLQNMFTYFKNAVHNSKPARDYLQSRCLDFKKTEVGYNAGQFHHGARKDETLIKQCLVYGLLLEAGLTARSGDTAYKPFGKWCICFALRNRENEIVSLYFRSTLADKVQRHFYLRDRQGLYPGYPKGNLPDGSQATKLILTESIIDAATLLEQAPIKSNYEILSLFGTNGLTEEHQKAIREWLQSPSFGVVGEAEIIFFLNGDEPGNKAVAKYAPMFKAEYPNIKITNVDVPQGEDVNSLLQGHSSDILLHLINTRKETDFIFSLPAGQAGTEKSTEKSLPAEGMENTEAKLFIASEETEIITPPETQPTSKDNAATLNTNNPYSLQYQGNACLPDGTKAMYQIKGFRVEQMDSLKITLQIVVPA